MFSKYRIFIFFVFLILLGCEKEDTIDKSYDCFEKLCQYNVNGELESWMKHYYMNGQVVKYEDSDGSWTTYEYDAFGNQIKLSSEFCDYEYEYDNMNNLVKMKFFDLGTYVYCIVYEYDVNKIMHSYEINSSNDTTRWSNYFYENEKLSHIESDNRDSYYYYSSEIDSIIEKRKDNSIFLKSYFKYSNEKLIYRAVYQYNTNEEIVSYFIYTWEYDNELLIRKTNKILHSLANYQYFDDRYIYNENNQKSRSESYDESGNLLGYGLYLYDSNDVIYRFESYNPSGLLIGYTIVENSCNQNFTIANSGSKKMRGDGILKHFYYF